LFGNREAATQAGFNVLRIISEPSATLLAYAIGQKDVSECWQVMRLCIWKKLVTCIFDNEIL